VPTSKVGPASQLRILNLYAEYNSADRVADQLGLTNTTVLDHVRRLGLRPRPVGADTWTFVEMNGPGNVDRARATLERMIENGARRPLDLRGCEARTMQTVDDESYAQYGETRPTRPTRPTTQVDLTELLDQVANSLATEALDSVERMGIDVSNARAALVSKISDEFQAVCEKYIL
jgi:antitoxin component of RelBE/YafQ-DinJ toxin-antitoxin module